MTLSSGALALLALFCACRGNALLPRGEGAFCDERTPCRRFFVCNLETQTCRPDADAGANDAAVAGEATHSVLIESPSSGPVTAPIVFRVTATPAARLEGLDLFVDDVLIASSQTAFLQFPFEASREGPLIALARGRFGALGVAEATLKLQVDLSPPQIRFGDEKAPRNFEADEPFDVTITDNLGAVNARGFVFRGDMEVAKLEDVVLTPFSSRVVFTVPGAALDPGPYDLVVDAFDRAGLSSRARLPFRKFALPGQTCAADDSCSSKLCVDGRCCLQACDGSCRTCGPLGQCVPVTNGSNRSCMAPMACNVRGECAPNTDRFQNCGEAQVAALIPVFEALAQALIVQPDPISACLKQAAVAGHVTAPPFDLNTGTSYPEQVLARMQALLPAHIRCVEGAGMPRVLLAEDAVHVDPARVATLTVAEAAAEVAAGLVDALGFWPGIEGSPETSAALRAHVGACVADHARGQRPPAPATRPRDHMAPEVFLAPVGQMRGAPFPPLRCAVAAGAQPEAEYVIGFHGDSTNALEDLWMTCRGASPNAQPRAVKVAGSYGPGQTCASDEVAIGAWGWADLNLRALAASCAPLAAVKAGRTDGARDLDLSKPATGLKFMRTCPPFMALRGLAGRAQPGAVNRIELLCADVRTPRKLGFSTLGATVVTAPDDVQSQLLCPNAGAVTDLYVRYDGTSVFRVGGLCDQLATGPDGKMQRRNQPVFLGASGGIGTADAAGSVDGCGDTGALVGLRLSTTRGDVLGGICVEDVATWNPASNPALLNAPLRGDTALPTTNMLCPKGNFIAGWQQSAGRTLTSLRLICREFGT